ncbi:hypothetical protein B7P43_G02161 [Cryptotermes secundus]|uniref:Elongation of very long chain fatty acids protein n=1 Tax=Cryptotermes secundus TaxID=105785 RepID=A0A2J7Q2M4_9NEOP|nr:elongation of very long chain fatty acids protein AAEL008004 [Cryptotermes secundus]PNF22838.1 hypothetical protein B7P43_G02161 [Cryptotermes secundus]
MHNRIAEHRVDNMPSIYSTFVDAYTRTFHDIADHRSDNWFLMGSPWPVSFIIIFYLYFVKILGPRLMKNRPAFNVDTFLRLYNLLQIILCTCLLKYILDLDWGRKYRLFCQPLDYTSPHGLYVAKLMYSYFLMKVFDLCDTVFMVLRKRDKQVSFLHLYHHIMVLLNVWIAAKFVPGGHGSIVGFLNTVVHAVMYSYYFVTSMWPEYKKNLWWKKYITQLQMGQFVFLAFHSFSAFIIKDCEYPAIMLVLIGTQNLILLILFANFYKKTYLKKKVM